MYVCVLLPATGGPGEWGRVGRSLLSHNRHTMSIARLASCVSVADIGHVSMRFRQTCGMWMRLDRKKVRRADAVIVRRRMTLAWPEHAPKDSTASPPSSRLGAHPYLALSKLADVLASLDLSHLADLLQHESVSSLHAQLRNGRPHFLQYLKSSGVSNLAERQRLANGLSRLARTGQTSPPPKPTGWGNEWPYPPDDGNHWESLQRVTNGAAAKRDAAETLQRPGHKMSDWSSSSFRTVDPLALSAAGLHDAAAIVAAGQLTHSPDDAAAALFSTEELVSYAINEASPRCAPTPTPFDPNPTVTLGKSACGALVKCMTTAARPLEVHSSPPEPGGTVLILSPDRAALWPSPPPSLHVLPAVMGKNLPDAIQGQMQAKARQARHCHVRWGFRGACGRPEGTGGEGSCDVGGAWVVHGVAWKATTVVAPGASNLVSDFHQTAATKR